MRCLFTVPSCWRKFRSLFKMRLRTKCYVLEITIIIVALVFYCEFFHYYVILSQCNWPDIKTDEPHNKRVYSMIMADTHLLGPFRGHWFDKLKREWQINRAFQTSVMFFRPEIIFMLGDLFDEGDFVNKQQYDEYLRRFHNIFDVPEHIKIVAVPGNHDVGFHYKMHPYFTDRFEENFANTGVTLYSKNDVHFVLINSMAMENDKCFFCVNANQALKNISNTLNCWKNPETCKNQRNEHRYSQPIIMQHFPTYRKSDKDCLEHDSPEIETYRENWEVLSKQATESLGSMLNPRVAFSGHSHHFCRLKNRIGIEEYTISSFSWRNKNNPKFLLAIFTPETYAISVCQMPKESTVLLIYCAVILGSFIFYLYRLLYKRR